MIVPVFKTGERQVCLSLVGSTPTRFRHKAVPSAALGISPAGSRFAHARKTAQLQNRRAAGLPVVGGFDPHSLPPLNARRVSGDHVRSEATTTAFACFFCGIRGGFKPNPPVVGGLGGHELANGFDEFLNVGVMLVQSSFKFRQLGYDLLLQQQRLAHLHKSAHYEDAHLDGAF